ncbi:ATP-binding protein [Streptomyces phyllanthi]|uniref:ATP-binding protein n=1 Tax=Streptomyces phyllanthi TaxID=1803180 RepID=A0A5N8W0Y2_9ACTN|nr:ATP-binding protein [Streptomyces phyllanthi]MPY41170.1 ATP-binding protein [Streptomyces phyllanthi]
MAIDYEPASAAAPAGVTGGGPPAGAVRVTCDRAEGRAGLRVPAALGSLDEVARFVLDLGGRAGLHPSGLYRLRLAADELATNIVVHGYRGAPGVIAVDGGIDADRVWVRFQDDAPAFDPRQGMRPPALDQPLAEREIGGLGVYLAYTAVDAFAYELVSGRNVSTLVMLRREGHPRAPRDASNEPTAE